MRKLILVVLLVVSLFLALGADTAYASPWAPTGTCDPKGPSTSGYEAVNVMNLNTNCWKDGTGPLK